MVRRNLIIHYIALASLVSTVFTKKMGSIPHSHVGHGDMNLVDLHERNSALSLALEGAALLQGATTYIECQMAQTLLQAAAALGINKGGSKSCSAPGSIPTPVVAALKPVAQNPVVQNPVAQAPAVVQAEVPSTLVVAGIPVVAIAGVSKINPIPSGMPNPTSPASPINLVSAALPLPTGDPCVSNNPDVCTQQALALAAHNSARALHHAPPLLWSNALAATSKIWADECQWKHSGGSLYPPSYVYGENLYASTLDEPQTSMTIAVQAFINEEAFYNYSQPGYSDATGHFTQVVWLETQYVGCSLINCDLSIFDEYTSSSAFGVCQYFPSGNYFGDFGSNVIQP